AKLDPIVVVTLQSLDRAQLRRIGTVAALGEGVFVILDYIHKMHSKKPEQSARRIRHRAASAAAAGHLVSCPGNAFRGGLRPQWSGPPPGATNQKFKARLSTASAASLRASESVG